ncbi:hypothetical protein HPP92_003526 [Vanilla planifolia]|uniref:RSE1/DDB1/CPSF1 second beta-propeller domain-containing protein n=1 Tax=Vanilla planifolia TaxID=51239 RepID=A0A835VJ15_VANPL|nr:hypothetical protein HPP92_003526 [Vanilla planifolia]
MEEVNKLFKLSLVGSGFASLVWTSTFHSSLAETAAQQTVPTADYKSCYLIMASSSSNGCSVSSIRTNDYNHEKNLPHDAYKLLAVPSPIGGVLVICANSIHYHSQSLSCALALNSFYTQLENSTELPKSHVSGSLMRKCDMAVTRCCLVFNKNRRTIAPDLVQALLDIASLTSAVVVTLLVDEDGDAPLSKKLRMSLDSQHDFTSSEELSLYSTAPKSSESTKKSFSFAVRDSLINVGPLKDFAYGLRINADSNATGICKQSNYELVCCSGSGKNGALCVMQQSVRPELISEVFKVEVFLLWPCSRGWEGVIGLGFSSTGKVITKCSLDYANNEDEDARACFASDFRFRNVDERHPPCCNFARVQGIWTVYHKRLPRRRVVQIFARGARILDGAYMTQEFTFGVNSSDPSSSSDNFTVSSASIADPYVLLKMVDGSVQLLIGDISTCNVSIHVPALSFKSSDPVSACTLYCDKGPDPWLRKASTDAWLSTGIPEAIDGNDVSFHEQDIYCLICYESGTLEIFDVPSFRCVFSVIKFIQGKKHLVDRFTRDPFFITQKVKN